MMIFQIVIMALIIVEMIKIIIMITMRITICIVKLRHFCNVFRAFLQLYGILATSYGNHRAFLQRFREFSQHIGHFCNIALPQYDLVLKWGIFPSTTSSVLSDEERGEV